MGNAMRMSHIALAGLLTACGEKDEPVGTFEAGPLGAVDIGEGEGV